MGAMAYKLFDEIKEAPEGSCILEIGSQRGEGSTDYFVKLGKRLGIPFYTVDINYDVYIWIAHKAHAFLMSGEEFLERVYPHMGNRIFIVYLDGFDWIWKGMDDRDFILKQKKEYDDLGYEMNNHNSKQSHLRQAKEIEKYTTTESHILFDDTWQTHNDYEGKGGFAVPYLLSKDYKVVKQSPISEEAKEGFVWLKR